MYKFGKFFSFIGAISLIVQPVIACSFDDSVQKYENDFDVIVDTRYMELMPQNGDIKNTYREFNRIIRDLYPSGFLSYDDSVITTTYWSENNDEFKHISRWTCSNYWIGTLFVETQYNSGFTWPGCDSVGEIPPGTEVFNSNGDSPILRDNSIAYDYYFYFDGEVRSDIIKIYLGRFAKGSYIKSGDFVFESEIKISDLNV